MSLIVTQSEERQSVDLVRKILSSHRRWNITEELRQEVVERTADLMRSGEEERTRLGAIKTLAAMERDNQKDQWKAEQLEVDSQKPQTPQVVLHNNTFTVSDQAVVGLLNHMRDRQKPPAREVIENAPVTETPTALSGQAPEALGSNPVS